MNAALMGEMAKRVRRIQTVQDTWDGIAAFFENWVTRKSQPIVLGAILIMSLLIFFPSLTLGGATIPLIIAMISAALLSIAAHGMYLGPKWILSRIGTLDPVLLSLVASQHPLGLRLARSHADAPAATERLYPMMLKLWDEAKQVRGTAADDIRDSMFVLAGNIPTSNAGVHAAVDGITKLRIDAAELIHLQSAPERARQRQAQELKAAEQQLAAQADAEHIGLFTEESG